MRRSSRGSGGGAAREGAELPGASQFVAALGSHMARGHQPEMTHLLPRLPVLATGVGVATDDGNVGPAGRGSPVVAAEAAAAGGATRKEAEEGAQEGETSL